VPATAPRLTLYPAIGLRHGRVVELAGGDPARIVVEKPSPDAQARAFEAAGSRWLHVVALDAAFGERNQWTHLARLLSDRRSRIQFGGGVRHMAEVQQLLDLGVERVVVGTQAVRNPLWLRELARIFPSRIVLALDGRVGDLLVEGWREEAGAHAVAVASAMDDCGLAAILYTEVDGTASPALVRELRAALARTPLLVGAPKATLADLDALAAAGVDGAVLGHNVLEGELDLAEALEHYPSPPVWPLAVVAAREELDGEPDDDEPSDDEA